MAKLVEIELRFGNHMSKFIGELPEFAPENHLNQALVLVEYGSELIWAQGVITNASPKIPKDLDYYPLQIKAVIDTIRVKELTPYAVVINQHLKQIGLEGRKV